MIQDKVVDRENIQKTCEKIETILKQKLMLTYLHEQFCEKLKENQMQQKELVQSFESLIYQKKGTYTRCE